MKRLSKTVKLFAILTFGCQMNVRDSETIKGILESLGYIETDNPDEADLLLFNTCSVRENPERKVYGRIQQYKEDSGKIIGICGCMVQQGAEFEYIKNELPQVRLVFGTHNIHELPELLEKAEEGQRVLNVWEDKQEIVEGLPAKRDQGVKAFVNISYGCNNFCTYCIVPYTRGREKSRTPENIISEVRELAQNGYKEVTLLGQNVNSYGKDLGLDFAALLEKVHEVEGIERIRFTTSHPKDLSDRLIAAFKNLPKLCEHLHLPVQAGSDRILKKMNRRYTREQYLELVAKLRDAVPGIALTTDIIVGFPGETEEDFLQTLDIVEKVRYDSAFTFIYSPRKGTPAAEMPDQVDEEVKKERIYRLIDLQNRISGEINQEIVGSTVEVLVEGTSKTDPSRLTGKTRSNKTINFPGDVGLIGRTVQVEVTAGKLSSLEGKLKE
ncbi:MAG: tRNA (N6-isopentenyl adenosine(37)-C2)-methylthiotransferase MiaB [Bacillota bacterium]|nr:tRNA (N6-isopentenyl adenosine(37)-C2)-methylthiotransferase MiaB [Bacillota bacterium]NLU54054.1 tRNA (N6-isopentenyl adenosine(37)-C2)-methylthiotransferase MiaB [Bacillota bacterium]HOA91778.1 tRNA (N6-isopentenyl adenosine(37)-C2)-methylthiotransferase MiaB [Bacillota bacterium]HOP54531.1 tRNA (N6-isopentenyl adenosine(37)-C2)-methylthiotransferase MiaB [Bacillota bacterium]HPZ73883.1 tRNA (N6-isopentenyl adenosine(37)-C2)-methylthiotransferase MiaB [Bacillota bacterium]